MADTKTSILLLEDDENLREVLQMTLEDADFEVTGCSDPDQAIEAARKRRFQLFITDVRMAGSTDGVGALVAIKAIRRTIRTIIITGYASEDVPVRAMKAQADDYLLKGDQGFCVAELLRVIRRVLDRSQPELAWTDRLRQWAALPHKIWIDSRLPQLEVERQSFYEQFFVGLRPGHLNPEQAYQVWRRLQDLELGFHCIAQVSQVKSLRAGYRALSDHLVAGQPLPEAPGVDRLTRGQVSHLVGLVRTGRVSIERLRLATILLLDPEARRQSAEAYACYCQLWGPLDPAVGEVDGHLDPRIGLIVAGHRVAEALEPVGDVQRYRVIPPAGQQPVLLEVIPVTAESSSALAREKARQTLRHGEKRDQHFWVLRDWDKREQTLSSWLRPGGCEAGDLVAGLRPLFESIYQANSQGLYDGGLNLSRVQLTARGPVVEDYSTYIPWRLFIERGKAVGGFQIFYIAPEVLQQSAGPPADQYSLGVMVYQLLTGSGPQDLAEILQARALLKAPTLQDAESLAPVLRKMMAPQPEQRFPNLGLAWRALWEAAQAKQG
jgi:DNA-binding response OmpR family regulator